MLNDRFFRCVLGLAALLCLTTGEPVLRADELRIATWNIREGFTPEKIAARSQNFADYAAKVRPDLLVIQEVTSVAVVEALRDAMGLSGYHIAVSNFNPIDPPDFGGFEVAILSRFPITQVVEYDPSPDNGANPDDPPEMPLLPLKKLGFETPDDVGFIRGFLWVRIDELRLTLAGVHLKSSRGKNGEEDATNAATREFVMAAVADSVTQDLRLFPEYTCVVAGDFNVGHGDSKNGVDLFRDDFTIGPDTDGYDDTHAILRDGIMGLKMRNLCEEIRETTFPGINSTPIDNIYVVGPQADRFAAATLEMDTFGSDHRTVHTTWTTTPRAAVAAPQVPAAPGAGTPAMPRPQTPVAETTDVVVGPADAAKFLNGRGTVEFVVQAANVQPSTPPIGFLNSEADFRSDDNFTVVVFDEGMQKFREAGVADFAAHFANKKIRVTGQVTMRRDRLQIVVSDPGQIQIVP